MGRCNPSRPGNRGGIRRHWAQGPTSLASGAYQRCVPGARRTLASAVLAGALLAVLSPVQAESEQWLDTLEGIHPYASLSYTDDSNLLRISDEGADIVGIDSRSDQYVTTEAGIDTSFDLSRQRISIDGRVYHNAYDRFSQFDHTGGDAKVAWDWLYGNLWDGEVSYSYTHRLRDFAYQDIPSRDMLTRHKITAGANRWLSPRWRAGGRGNWVDISSSERDNLDKQLWIGDLSLDWVSPSNNTAGLALKYTDGQFDTGSDRDFQEWEFGPTMRWKVSPKTRLIANAGYLKRTHEESDERDFQGFVGRVVAKWQPTGKTSIDTTVAREISNLDDEIANYAVVDSISVEPRWAVTAKTTVRATASYEKQDYRGANAVTDPLIDDREDDITSYGLWVDWAFLRNGLLSVGYSKEDRNSTRVLEDYDSDVVEATVRLGL